MNGAWVFGLIAFGLSFLVSEGWERSHQEACQWASPTAQQRATSDAHW